MAKVTVVFTRPGKEYKQQDADSLVRDLDGLIEKLNSTFQQDLRDEQQRFTWFENLINISSCVEGVPIVVSVPKNTKCLSGVDNG